MSILPGQTNLPLLLCHPASFARQYWWALAILVIGGAADGLTTYLALRQFGIEAEMHIVQRWASEILGVALGVPLAKIGQMLFVILVAAWWRRWTSGLLVACGLLYGLAALNNHYLWL